MVVPVVEKIAVGIEASLAGNPLQAGNAEFQISLPGMVAETEPIYATA